MTWFLILGYLGLQLTLGWLVSRRIKNETDYLIAGRRLSWPLVTFSMFATWFGAETCIGSAGAIYEEGLAGGRADPLGYCLCLVLMGLFLAGRLWRGNFITLADLYRTRFGPLVEKAAVIVLVPSSLIWAAAQVRAFGQVLASTTELHVDLAIALSAAFVVAYTLLGGLLGDVITDLVQGGLLALGLFIVFAASVAELGGPSAFAAAVAPERLSLMPPGESVLEQVDRWMIPILGSLVAQELVARVLAARSAAVARGASLLAAAVYLLVGTIPVALGLVGPSLLPGLEDAEQLLPKLARNVLPPVLFAVFTGALISAILSTIDSILLSIGALVSHNLLVPLLRIDTERSKLRSARAVVLVAGVLAFVLALYSSGVYDLVEAASSFGTAGVLVITLAAMYGKRASGRAALAALLAGLVATPVLAYFIDFRAPFLGSIAISALVFFVVGRFGHPTWSNRASPPAQ